MKFLSKLGAVILKATEIVTGLQGFATTIFPGQAGNIQTVSTDLTQIANIIIQVETVGQVLNLPGADKLRGATPAVAQILLQSSILVGHEIANPVLFQQGAGKIADGMADVLNSLKDNVATASKT